MTMQQLSHLLFVGPIAVASDQLTTRSSYTEVKIRTAAQFSGN
jgi:hypothetical protein